MEVWLCLSEQYNLKYDLNRVYLTCKPDAPAALDIMQQYYRFGLLIESCLTFTQQRWDIQHLARYRLSIMLPRY